MKPLQLAAPPSSDTPSTKAARSGASGARPMALPSARKSDAAPGSDAAVEAGAAVPSGMAEAVIDLSSYDWLAFPHWAKALELNNFPKLLLWLTEQDAVLAGTVALRQEEFEIVFDKIKQEMETEQQRQPQEGKGSGGDK